MATITGSGAGNGGDKELPDLSKLTLKDDDEGVFKVFPELRRVQKGHEKPFESAEQFSAWADAMITELRALSSNSITGGDWLEYLRGLNIRINLTYTGFNSTIDISFNEEIDMSRNVTRDQRRVRRMEQFIAFILRVRDIFNAYQAMEM